MHYAKEFFDLNARFAQKAAQVTGMSIERALLDYTYLYLSFNLGRAFDPQDATWQDYLAGLLGHPDPAVWTHDFYLRQQHIRPRPLPEPAFGCFSYSRMADGRVRLHFHNAEPGGVSPLSRERLPARRAELTALFAHLKPSCEIETRVMGASWLYNIEAYRRLFPPAYLATARASDVDNFRYIVLWGQFVDHCGRVKPALAEPFLQRLDCETTLDGLRRSFPYPVLFLERPIYCFYEHFCAGM